MGGEEGAVGVLAQVLHHLQPGQDQPENTGCRDSQLPSRAGGRAVDHQLCDNISDGTLVGDLMTSIDLSIIKANISTLFTTSKFLNWLIGWPSNLIHVYKKKVTKLLE